MVLRAQSQCSNNFTWWKLSKTLFKALSKIGFRYEYLWNYHKFICHIVHKSTFLAFCWFTEIQKKDIQHLLLKHNCASLWYKITFAFWNFLCIYPRLEFVNIKMMKSLSYSGIIMVHHNQCPPIFKLPKMLRIMRRYHLKEMSYKNAIIIPSF